MDINTENINTLLQFAVYYAYAYAVFVPLMMVIILIILFVTIRNTRRQRKAFLQARAMDVTTERKAKRRGFKL